MVFLAGLEQPVGPSGLQQWWRHQGAGSCHTITPWPRSCQHQAPGTARGLGKASRLRGCSGRSKALVVPLWFLLVRLCLLTTLLEAESENPRGSFEILRTNKNFQVLLICPHGNFNSPKVSCDTPEALRGRAHYGAMVRMASQERLWLHT